ncbi:MAG: hypothetical protein P5694_24110 [Limnospira sp. PMC 1286.21]|nr:hypothetical protein [Limnospira sp. PMC 1286.21]
MQSNRDLLAYPYHYSRALASGHISHPQGIRLHLSLLSLSTYSLRTLEDLKRSVYTGIPSLDLSSPPGYF